MTPADRIALVWAAALLALMVGYISREIYRARHKHGTAPITTDLGLMLLLSQTGPLLIWEMRAFGVTWPRSRVRRLMAMDLKYLQRDRVPGGWLYGLTEAGGRRVRAARAGQ